MWRPLTEVPASVRSLALLLLVCGCLFFVGLGRLPLLEPDEGRNAEVSREMLVLHDWVTPHYDHLTYVDKPAFLFWMTAGAFRCFGVSEWSARFPSALLGLATAVLVWAMARRMSGKAIGVRAAVIFATSPLVFWLARFVVFDVPLTFFVTVAMYCLWLNSENSFTRPWLDGAAFAAMGIATLIKGPVGFLLPLLTLVVYEALRRRLGALKKLHWGLGWIVFFAITLPWFIEVSIRNPGFPKYAFWNESLGRFFAGVYMHRSEGPWYYIPVYFFGFFPWSFFLLFAGWTHRRRLRAIWQESRSAELFLLSWASVVFVFFSISHSKLPGYVLPGIVPLSILLAMVWPEAEHASASRIPDWLTAGFAIMILFGLVMAGSRLLPLHQIEPRLARKIPVSTVAQIQQSLFFGGVILLALGVLGRHMAASSRKAWTSYLAFPVVALTTPLLVLRMRGPLKSCFDAFSSRGLADTILMSPENSLTIYGYYYFRTSLPFYLERPVGLVTQDGDELTSNYVVANFNAERATMLPFDWRPPGVLGSGTSGPERGGFAGPAIKEPALITGRQLKSLSESPPGPFLILGQNNEINELARAAGAITPRWTGWCYSVWEKMAGDRLQKPRP
jgi:4-amino-4-deoxy-L-arabinose transferase-like glycosyltransferase